LDTVGLFDETFPACEDYDLWLRIGCRYPIGLLKKPLVIKRGGHPDQLSATVPTLDVYRIRSIVKMLRSGGLTSQQRQAALQMLTRKCAIHGEGCRKRGNFEAARAFLNLPQAFVSSRGQFVEEGGG
jgi:hypothetical protein